MRCPLRITQTGRKSLVHARAGNSVHVTRDDDRTAIGRMAKPLRTKQCIDLHQPFRSSETKMGIDDLQLRPLDLDCGPEGAARLHVQPPGKPWQWASLDDPRRTRGQNGIAILFFHHAERCVEMHLHPERFRDSVSLIDSACSSAPHVELL